MTIMPWYVLYTKPKAEKKAADQLSRIGIEVYCPLVTKMSQWSDRLKKVEVPLFTSYVFVNIEDSKRDTVFAVPGVVRYLFWLGKPAIVRDEEISNIKQWLTDEVATVEMENIRKGDTLEIKEGPFKSHTGLVQQVNKNTVRLLIESLGVMLTLKYNSLQ